MSATTRYCRDCDAELAIDSNWRSCRAKRHDYICNICSNAHKRRHYQENREQILAKQKAHYQENRVEILARQKEFYQGHAEQIKARANQWYRDNRDRARAQHRRYYQEHKVEFSERSRRYRENNREANRARTRRWARNNPSKIREKQRRRLAQKAGAVTHKLDEMFIYERDRYACVYCSDPHDLTLDHVVPLSKGGAHKYDNLAVACRSCNSGKGAKEVLGWLATRQAA